MAWIFDTGNSNRLAASLFSWYHIPRNPHGHTKELF